MIVKMPFPPRFPTLLQADVPLGAALTAAIAEAALSFPSLGVPPRSAISVVAIDETTARPQFKHAGFRERETHFSASLLKSAAMFAAFALRQSVTNFALTAAECDANVLFPSVAASFDSTISGSVQLISDRPDITPAMKVPKYDKIFRTEPMASGGCLISFTDSFTTSLRDMIVKSDNSAASTCIQRLGYSWIKGLLAHGGFFDSTTEQGIWLAGTFTGAFPAVRVPSANDGPSAQAMTCFDMANLYALIIERTALESRSVDGICDGILELLAAAQGFDPSWMTAGARQGITGLDTDFTITHTKIGVGPLNSGPDIFSEATIVRHDPTGSRFIVVWQNTREAQSGLSGISFIVQRTIEHFLGLP